VIVVWAAIVQMRRRLLGIIGEERNATSVFAANFSAGFVAGTLAAAATCPLDVAKTRRQIEVSYNSFCMGFYQARLSATSVEDHLFSALI